LLAIHVISKIADIKPLLIVGRSDPAAAMLRLRELALSDDWQTREVAATALVEIGKTHPKAVLAEANEWSRDRDHKLRRAASEGLRGIVQLDPAGVRPILERLRADPDRYVQKSVANVLRNGSRKQAAFVLELCAEWARSADPNTRWIVKEGLRKLAKLRRHEVVRILDSLAPSA
jgi:3-methyladenine DNA glycosylase AlkC